MVINALLAMLSAAAANALLQAESCNPQQIVASGRITRLDVENSALGLEPLATGLRVTDADEVEWTACSTKLQARVYGGWAITESGIPVIPTEQHLVTRDDMIPPQQPEPRHPAVPNATFSSSTSLQIGDQRAGLWSRSDGSVLVARYRPGQAYQPTPILISKNPILGLFYLGAPDSQGGVFQIWQRLPMNKYRYIHVEWSEVGVR